MIHPTIIGRYSKWAKVDGISLACLASRGNLRAVAANLRRAGWHVVRVERWTGSCRGIACYLICERTTK